MISPFEPATSYDRAATQRNRAFVIAALVAISIVGVVAQTTGPKREAASFRQIAATLREEPRDVLFISDVPAELDAARAAGMRTVLCIRGAPPSAVAAAHPRIHSFAELA